MAATTTPAPRILAAISGIDAITCHGYATLTPASVEIRYHRHDSPTVRVSGPTSWPGSEPVWAAWDFGGCTCRTWLTDIVETHRPKGFSTWHHQDIDTWRVIAGRRVNVPGAPDPRDPAGALKAALDEAGDCEALRSALLTYWDANY